MNRNLLVIVALGTLLPAIASAAGFTSPVRDVASRSPSPRAEPPVFCSPRRHSA